MFLNGAVFITHSVDKNYGDHLFDLSNDVNIRITSEVFFNNHPGLPGLYFAYFCSSNMAVC